MRRISPQLLQGGGATLVFAHGCGLVLSRGTARGTRSLCAGAVCVVVAASHRAVYGFECRRRQKVGDLAQAERRQPLSVGRESVPDVQAVAESKVGQVAALIDYP